MTVRPPVPTHCPYCALQCGTWLFASSDGVAIEPNPHFPVNNGGLCAKGWSAAAPLQHPERLLTPLIRTRRGVLAPTSWDDALGELAGRLHAIQERHGRDAVGVFGSGALTNEKAYLLGKFARVALGTANVDYNGRFCMSSAAAASVRAFGLDRGLPFPVADIGHASVLWLAGANPAETMPPIMQHFETQQRGGGQLFVADPRRTATARWADVHLRLRPGTDAALANGVLHVLIRDGLTDTAYIAARTDGFDEARQVAAAYWPGRTELITGVPERDIVALAHALGRAERPMILTARGAEQHAQGVNNTLAYINVALALGSVGRPASGFGTLTGQGNGQGGREHGLKADQLPGYRRITDGQDRSHIARLWQIDEERLPHAGRSAFELLDACGDDVHGLFVMGANPLVSSPDARRIACRLASLDTLAVADFFLSETAALARIVLPSAQWAEEDGTMTNLEGRVLRRQRAAAPPAGVRTDLEIISSLAAALGRSTGFVHTSTEQVFDELRRATAGAPADYAGISYARIEREGGVFWPCPSIDHQGTPRLFADAFPTATGRARFHATPHAQIADPRSDRYPLHLTTGRIAAHYQSGTQTRRTPALAAMAAQPLAEIHPTTAALAGISEGEALILTTRRGSARFVARLTRTVREDTVFVPFHWGGELAINGLTIAALDPVSRMPEFKVCAVRVAAAEAGT